MFVLGHTVVGPSLVRLVKPRLPLGWLVLGGALPDLIDKPLYYGLVLATGRRAADLGLVSGTRTFGHTGLLLLLLTGIALWRRSAVWSAVAFGVASHLLLDNIGDLVNRVLVGPPDPPDSPTAVHALLFPLLGPRFPISPFTSVREHLLSAGRAYVLFGEALGAVLLARWLWLRRRQVAA
jgi:hypothetical protein